ncbi:hypothetical protein [Faecalitalea cylindroides]
MELLYAYTYFIVYAFLGWVCEDIYCGIGKRKRYTDNLVIWHK